MSNLDLGGVVGAQPSRPDTEQHLARAFLHGPVALSTMLGPALLGVVDASFEGVAEAISALLFRSIADAHEQVGGHLPGFLVDDIRRNYISADKVRTLWAPTGHRFALVLGGEIVGTVHVARHHDNIFTIDRNLINVSASVYRDFKPAGYHHVVNLSVKHELRRARLASAMFDGVIAHFRRLFDGEGLWVRADPPWHQGLVGLGFEHDPSNDVFLPATVVRTAGLPHHELNARYACSCRPERPMRPEALSLREQAMSERKLQYVSFTRPFERRVSPARTANSEPLVSDDPSLRDACSRDAGGLDHALPSAVAAPRSADEVAAALSWASARGLRVAVRGAGQSAAGKALSPSGLVLSTARMTGIDVGPDTVTVQAGASVGALVDALLERGRALPVTPSWLAATVGGVLATGGLGKGSHRSGLLVDHVRALTVVTGDGRVVGCSPSQARWLFEAALGGSGACCVIAEATLAHVAAPSTLTLRRASTPDTASLVSWLRDASSEAASHVTSLYSLSVHGDAHWVAIAAGSDPGDGEVVPFGRHVTAHRNKTFAGPARFVHLLLPAAGVVAYVDAVRAQIDPAGGDSLSVMPVRAQGAVTTSLLEVPASPGELAYAVLLTREVRGREVAALDGQGAALCDIGASLGAKSLLQGALPRDAGRLSSQLGGRAAHVLAAIAAADPAGLLGAGLGLPFSALRRPA